MILYGRSYISHYFCRTLYTYISLVSFTAPCCSSPDQPPSVDVGYLPQHPILHHPQPVWQLVCTTLCTCATSHIAHPMSHVQTPFCHPPSGSCSTGYMRGVTSHSVTLPVTTCVPESSVSTKTHQWENFTSHRLSMSRSSATNLQ